MTLLPRMLRRALTALALFVPMVLSVPAGAIQFDWNEAAADTLKTRIGEGTYGTVTSVLILKDGRTLLEAYFNGAEADTLHDTRSVTKTITGMALGHAVGAGAVSLDQEAAQFFSDIAPFANPDPRKFEITLEDLLTMSCVLECNDWNQHSRGNEERMYIVEDWPSFFWDLPVRGYPAWVTKPEDSPYGRTFSYCTAGVQMLGEIVERATGTPFTDYVETHLFAPLGITSFEWPRNGLGQAHMGGGLKLTAHGLARFAEVQRLGGVRQGTRILDEDWTRASVTPHARIPDTPDWLYGYLWWLRPYSVAGADYRVAMMNGNGGNRVMVLEEAGLTVVLTKTDYNTRGMHQKSDAFLEEEILKRLSAD